MNDSNAIAVIGMACRLPGGSTVDDFWATLTSGRDCIRRDFDRAGRLLRAGGVLDAIEDFDTNLFPMSAREAALLDPQHRIFLECCWSALESAGIPPLSAPGLVGLFGGSGPSTYLINNVLADGPRRGDLTYLDSLNDLQMLLASDKEYLSSRVAYHLDLRGPVMTIQAACATGLFAVHSAAQSLLNGECDLALAGASSVSVPQMNRHSAEEGLILSPDGRCRSYDAEAAGTVFGSGCGVVVLKLLEDAEQNGDPILAVIRGSAVGNDGARKVGMTAPSVAGQVAVISDALAVAGIAPHEISYLEGHGTATPVGDPIEIIALNEVFGTVAGQSIALGSVKTNIGHLGTAAGMAGLIKTILCLRYRTLVPSLNFSRPHPDAPFADGPFTVVTETRPWTPQHGSRRRAGVSAFGLGGANAHVVIEEYNTTTSQAASPREPCLVFPISAASPNAVRNTASELNSVRDVELADVACTLSTGREHLPWRAAIAASDVSEFTKGIGDLTRGHRRPVKRVEQPKLGVLCTGYLPEAITLRGLTRFGAVQSVLDAADPLMTAETGKSARDVLLTDNTSTHSLATAQPAQFVLQTALLSLWREWGVVPNVVLGHSLGEFAAAYAAGVLDLEGGIRMVAARARLLEALPVAGNMAVIEVSVGELDRICAQLDVQVAVGAINGPTNTVVSGPAECVDRIVRFAKETGRQAKHLRYGTAGHSDAVDGVLTRYAECIQDIPLERPSIPLISCVTGGPVDQEVSTHDYWVRHLRETVRFADAIDRAEALDLTAYLEVGPAPVLCGMHALSFPETKRPLLPSLRPGADPHRTLLASAATLYEHGIHLNWQAINPVGMRRQLPTYGFDRTRHWIGPDEVADQPPLYRVAWQLDVESADQPLPGHWLVIEDTTGTADAIIERLSDEGHLITRGSDIGLTGDASQWAPTLTAFLNNPPIPVSGVLSFDALNFESVTIDEPEAFPAAAIGATYRAVSLLQAVTSATTGPPRTWLFTRNSVAIGASDVPSPSQAGIAALARTAVREFPDLRCFRVDLQPEPNEADDAAAVLTEISRCNEADVAYRSRQRHVRRVVRDTRVPHEPQIDGPGTYLITGGFSALGTLTAAALIRCGAERVVIVGRADDGPGRRTRTRDKLAQLLENRSDLDSHINFDYADVTKPEAVSALVHRNDLPSAPLRGVVHAAGMLADGTLHNQTHESITAAFSAKVVGAVHLHHALQSYPDLELFVCFTSATGVLGNPGQANYAAANAILERLMETREQQRLAGQCIAWGPWAEVGHLAERPDILHALAQSGMGSLTTRVGTNALEKALGNSSGTVAVLSNDWLRWRAGSNEVEEPSFRDLIPASSEITDDTNQAAALLEILQTLENNQGNRAFELACSAVRNTAEKVLGGTIDDEQSLRGAGLDSLSAVQLRNGLAQFFGIPLPVDICLAYDSAAAITNHLIDLLAIGTRDDAMSAGLP